MTARSKLCNLIASTPNWRDVLTEKGITVKTDGNLAIFTYGLDCDFTDPIVQESRGIIIDLNTLTVVCWPFRKFGNYGESYIDTIDWTTARVQEKIDGSLIKLWYNDLTKTWSWSTNGMINADEALTMNGVTSFMKLIKRATNYGSIDYDKLDKDKTYLFELVAPEQKIVIAYDFPYLYHIGTRSNITGEESNDDIGMPKPHEYSLRSLDDCLTAAQNLNPDRELRHEGFVVVDAAWHRIKIKSPEYLYAHRLSTYKIYTKKKLLPLIRQNEPALEELLHHSPDSEIYVRYYQWQYAEFKRKVRTAIAKARGIYEEFNFDKKATAGILKNEPLSSFCFAALGNNLSAEDLIDKAKDPTILRFIEDYPEDEGT